ncbi:Crp/Fnr family transcriptional regulator [Sphingomonas sp. M1-B02]|uniref:Crp/Fnr family transcriptional regulator n=1 Tax=Sphingomonas sp. M1-B02 TaxID=3114300 RepID=UPI0022408701|nr:Crp/Fnr family transcriptional regulator [Sphingomonas sp. S6-11]UZK66048.1 Crp/Fnr family transcriptional regulator [Sphingomonas sp. S6-11]
MLQAAEPSHPCTSPNALLRSLHPADQRLLSPHLASVALKAGEVVERSGVSASTIFFPETAVISVLDGAGEASRPDLGVIGREGMVGWTILLGDCQATTTAVVRVPGTSLAIRPKPLVRASHLSKSLQAALLGFVHDFMGQMAGTIVSSAESLERRVARWLILLHDRTEGDALALTHDHICSALHVRRASVTDTVHVLEGYGALKCSRSRIVVRDRARLELAAGVPARISPAAATPLRS